VTQVARAQPVSPASEPERLLLEAVDHAYPSVAEFCRQIAVRTKQTPDAEESAFYRIIRGKVGSKTAYRIGHYAELLGVDATPFLRTPERPAASDPAHLEDLLRDVAETNRRVIALLERLDV